MFPQYDLSVLKVVNDMENISSEDFMTRHSEQYNEETLAAMRETLDIVSGKIKVKQYNSVEELMKDLMSDDDD